MSLDDHEKKLSLIQESLIKRFPGLKEDFEANPDILKKIFAELPLELHSKRTPKPEFTPDQIEKAHKFYPQVSLLYEYLRPVRKQWINSNECSKKLQEAALIIIKNHSNLFPDITPEHLNPEHSDLKQHFSNAHLYNCVDAQPKRYFCGGLLEIMMYHDTKRKRIRNTLLDIL